MRRFRNEHVVVFRILQIARRRDRVVVARVSVESNVSIILFIEWMCVLYTSYHILKLLTHIQHPSNNERFRHKTQQLQNYNTRVSSLQYTHTKLNHSLSLVSFRKERKRQQQQQHTPYIEITYSRVIQSEQ